MEITVDVTYEQIEALKEWEPMLKYALDDYEFRAYPENHDYSINPPEIIQEQKFIRNRIKLIKELISHINNIVNEFEKDEDNDN